MANGQLSSLSRELSFSCSFPLDQWELVTWGPPSVIAREIRNSLLFNARGVKSTSPMKARHIEEALEKEASLQGWPRLLEMDHNVAGLTSRCSQAQLAQQSHHCFLICSFKRLPLVVCLERGYGVVRKLNVINFFHALPHCLFCAENFCTFNAEPGLVQKKMALLESAQ